MIIRVRRHSRCRYGSRIWYAIDRADLDAAVQMFEEESYWRDLVFTWNIKTLEGKENI